MLKQNMPQDGLFLEYLIRPKRAAALGKVIFVDIYTHSARLRRLVGLLLRLQLSGNWG